MNITTSSLLTGLLLSAGSVAYAKDLAEPAAPEAAAKPVVEQKGQVIEVCFVLDTTGSMGGLIQGAKQKIWSIANGIAQQKPAPTIKFSLIGYRDRGDAYITKVFDLTDDLDAIHGELMKFKADGGGDGPESVNQALNEAVTKLQWSKDKKTKKVIFLVGDAPPHMDYKQDVTYSTSCELAAKKGIIVNTIQCGNMASCTPVWQQIAKLGKGEFVALPQSGGTVAIKSPQDVKIAELSKKIYQTVVPYGDVKKQKQARWKKSNALNYADEELEGNVARYSCLNASGIGVTKAFSGNNDLIAEWGDKKVTLKNLKKEHLPKEWQGYTEAKLKAEIAQRLATREEVQKQLNKLLLERSKHIEKVKKLKPEAVDKAFDVEVDKLLKKQLK